MSILRIDNKAARQLWLTSQGLGTAPTGPLDVLGTIKDLGFVQLDTIQVVARAHHHILWSRNQNYREPMLDDVLGRQGGVFEHFTHDASVIPMEYLPLWQRQFTRKKAQMDKAGWLKNLPNTSAREGIKNRIREEGPLSTHAFESTQKGPKKMWARPPHKIALDYMWYCGELATSHRENFTKFYDLAERVFPQDLHRSTVSDEAQIDWLCHGALTRMGFGSTGDVQRYWAATTAPEVRAWHKRFEGALVPVEVETAQGAWMKALAPADISQRLEALKPVTSRLRILSPFDPVIRDRTRLSRLFGFEYRVEMFVPAAKRIWGYYVYPILEGDRFIGRIEVKADRKASVLTVLNLWQEAGVVWSKDREKKLASELERMRKFTGVARMEWAVPR